ncbi:DUF2079 domain-containing protein [Streptomyces barkulensis]|uniref:DUF2079 domain-containing protein n=1 Tax=Streptomyces barkulensis TaxID=1257026 RepID=UPI001F0FDFFD|nr:DUF2079 domain-containing protein [Streptomyces barkulensis]
MFTAYATLSIARYTRFGSMSWDLAIFEQVTRSYAHLQSPIAPIKGPDFNILGDHFSPVLVLLAPLYRLFPSPVTLLVVQAVLFAVSAAVVSDTAARFLGRIRGLLTGAAYGLSWGIQRAVDFDFHEIAFAVPLLAVILRNLLLERWRHVVCWCVPLVLVKEDLGLTVAAVGICLLLARRRAQGIGLMVFGTAATATVLLVIIPMFNPGSGYDYWEKVAGAGSDSPGWPGGLLEGIGTKGETLLWIVGVTAFLALRSPLVLVALPTLGWRFLSHEPNYWSTDWHYSAVLMPIMFMALIDAVRSAPRSSRVWVRRYARNAVPAVAAISATLCLQLPLRDLTQPETYDGGPRASAARVAVSRIPDGATVEANTGLMTHLTGRTTVYWVGNTGALTPQYIALDLASGWSAPLTDPAGYVRQLHPDARYDLVFHHQQYAVLALRGAAGQDP